MNTIQKALLAVLSMLAGQAMAQDIQFTQFYATPLYQNPALTGGQLTSRAAVHYRNQWVGIGNGFSTVLASFDHQGYGQSMAWGIQLLQDRQGQTGPTSSEVQASLAYSWLLSDDVQVRAGLQGGLVSRGFDYSRLQFVEQFSNGGLVKNHNSEQFGSERIMYPELAAGAVLHTRQAWVGMAAHHLTRPRQSFYEDALSSIPMRYTVHAGMRISLKGGNDYYPTNPFQAISVMPMIQYRMQEKFDQLDVGAQFRYAPLLLGVWYRGLPGIKSYEGLPNHDALAFLLGVELPSGLSVGYSYDVTVSTFANSVTYGAHEISVIYQWAMGDEAKHVRKRGVRFDVPFPKM